MTEPMVVIRTIGARPLVVRDDGGDGMTIEGYIAKFDETIRVWDWEVGEAEETIARGAFAKSIAERTPIMLWNHGRDITGGIPIGRWVELKEDRKGLFGRGRLFDNDLVGPVREAIDNEAITGQSFMAEPLVVDRQDRKGKLPLVTLRELRMIEGGPVTFPAYTSTSVAVRSLWPGAPIETRAEDPATPDLGAGADQGPPVGAPAVEPPNVAATYAELARIMGRRYPEGNDAHE